MLALTAIRQRVVQIKGTEKVDLVSVGDLVDL